MLAVTTMPGDDVTHPVPDNTGYITEGQFYLRNGRIEPFGSLSRLKQQVNGTHAGRSPHDHEHDDPALRGVQGEPGEAVDGVPHERLGREAAPVR